MQGESKEHWIKLCIQASTEQDPDELIRLVREAGGLKNSGRFHAGWLLTLILLFGSYAIKSVIHQAVYLSDEFN
jgi:hypothetical protein